MKKQFIVIGLGRFGVSLVKTLIENKHEVLAVDKDLHLVESVADIATQAIQGDGTDEDVLDELDVAAFDYGIVAIGDDLQANILTTLLLKEKGVPHVTSKAKNNIYGRVLQKIGADKVVYPERDMGRRLGKQFSSNNLIDYIELSPDYNLVEMKAPPKMDGHTLQELNVRAKFGCNIIAIKTKTGMNVSPRAEDKIKTGDILFVIGNNQGIREMEDKYEGKS